MSGQSGFFTGSAQATETSVDYNAYADKSKLLPSSQTVQLGTIYEDGTSEANDVYGRLANFGSKQPVFENPKSDSEYSSRSSTSASESGTSYSTESERSSRYTTETSSNETSSEYDSRSERSRRSRRSHRSSSGTKTRTRSKRHYEAPKLMAPVVQQITDPRELKFRKMKIINELNEIVRKYKKKLSQEYSINSSLEDLEFELKIQSDDVHKESLVEGCTVGIVKASKIIEAVNQYFDPFGIKLKGWSNSIEYTKDNFKQPLGDLIEKYKDAIPRSPEFTLVAMFAMSAYTYHEGLVKAENSGAKGLIEKNPTLAAGVHAATYGQVEKTMVAKKPEEVQKEQLISEYEMYERMRKEKAQQNASKKDPDNSAINKIINGKKKPSVMDLAESTSVHVRQTGDAKDFADSETQSVTQMNFKGSASSKRPHVI